MYNKEDFPFRNGMENEIGVYMFKEFQDMVNRVMVLRKDGQYLERIKMFRVFNGFLFTYNSLMTSRRNTKKKISINAMNPPSISQNIQNSIRYPFITK